MSSLNKALQILDNKPANPLGFLHGNVVGTINDTTVMVDIGGGVQIPALVGTGCEAGDRVSMLSKAGRYEVVGNLTNPSSGGGGGTGINAASFVIPYSGKVENVPDGFLYCDGRAVSKAQYPELYDQIGGTYGETATTFNLPGEYGGGSVVCTYRLAALEFKGEQGDPGYPSTTGHEGEYLSVVSGQAAWKKAMALLWTNPSPTASFVAQTVQASLTSYDLILVIARSNSTYQYENSTIAIKGRQSLLSAVWGDSGRTISRGFNSSNTGVTFEAGYTSSVTNNAYMIPYQIYGIKL